MKAATLVETFELFGAVDALEDGDDKATADREQAAAEKAAVAIDRAVRRAVKRIARSGEDPEDIFAFVVEPVCAQHSAVGANDTASREAAYVYMWTLLEVTP